MLQRAFRASRLDASLYEEVEYNTSYTQEAATVVVLANLLGAIGAWLGPGQQSLIGAILTGVLGGVIGWLVWSGIVLLVGTKIFNGTADYGEMLRVLGYATAPIALGIIPVIGGFVGAILAIIAGVIAVRQGLDFSTGRAIGTVIIGFIGYVIVVAIIGAIFAGIGLAGAPLLG
ncbi:MAG: YIP1 family protein [Actinomycetota bacterium]|nr:YIP1 family protein [Actinomycetota bacterium]